nr:MAG TPA: tetratricopeptide repeat protein [Caudoviricetes sp.]
MPVLKKVKNITGFPCRIDFSAPWCYTCCMSINPRR